MDDRKQRPRAVVCLSGGMDSSVCAALAARDYQAYALHFSYGQRTESRELESARAVAEAVGIQDFLPLRMDLFRSIGGSALTDLAIDVPHCRPPSGAAFRSHMSPFEMPTFCRLPSVGPRCWAPQRSSSEPWSRTAPVIRIAGRLTMRLFSNLSASAPARGQFGWKPRSSE